MPDKKNTQKQFLPIFVIISIAMLANASAYNNFLYNSNFGNIDCPKQMFTSQNFECLSYFTPSSWYAVNDKNLLSTDFKARFVTGQMISLSANNQRAVTLSKQVEGVQTSYQLRQKIDYLPFGQYKLKISAIVGHSSNFSPNQAQLAAYIFNDEGISKKFKLNQTKSKVFQSAGLNQFQLNFQTFELFDKVYVFLFDNSSANGYTIGLKQVTLERIGDTCQLGSYQVQFSDGSSECRPLSSLSSLQQFIFQPLCKVWNKQNPSQCQSWMSYCYFNDVSVQTKSSGSISITRVVNDCLGCYPPYQLVGTQKCQLFINPSDVIAHCTMLKPNAYLVNKCTQCSQGYQPSSDQTVCVPISCQPNQQLINLELNNQVTHDCLTSTQLIQHCSLYQFTDSIFTCKTCNQNYTLVDVFSPSATAKKCISSRMLVDQCLIYVQFLGTCLYKCQTCEEGSAIGNVKQGSKIVQKCLNEVDDILLGCSLYIEDNGGFYCEVRHCSAESVQILIGMTAKQIACTTFATFDEKCQIYQRPSPFSLNLRCAQCKDPSNQLPYCDSK